MALAIRCFTGAVAMRQCSRKIRATAGSSINIAAFWSSLAATSHSTRHRQARSLSPMAAEPLPARRPGRARTEHPCGAPPDVALAVQLVDAFLADRFSRPRRKPTGLRNLIARRISPITIDRRDHLPSVAHPGGTNYAIKADVGRERLESACVRRGRNTQRLWLWELSRRTIWHRQDPPKHQRNPMDNAARPS